MGVGTYLLAAGGGVLIGTPVAIGLVVLGSLFLLVAGASTEPVQRHFPYLARLPLIARVADKPQARIAAPVGQEASGDVPYRLVQSEPTLPEHAGAADDPTALVRRYSSWLSGKRAALPDWPTGNTGLRGGLRTDSPVYRAFEQTRNEVQRQARVEYHERFREAVLAVLGEEDGQASNPRTISDLEAIEQRLQQPVEAPGPSDGEPEIEQRPKLTPPPEQPSTPPPKAPRRSEPAPTLRDPKDDLAEQLARLHDEGRRLKRYLFLASAPAAGEAMTGDPPKTRVECDEQTRAWDGRVTAVLLRHGDTSRLSGWQSSATLPAAHPTLRRIEPATTLVQLREFVDAKQTYLREIIETLGDATPARQGTEAVRGPKPTPTDSLRTALSEGMRLRTRVVMEGHGHWEGENFVLETSVPLAPDDPLYRWARRTYDLLTKHFPEHADAFFGDSPNAGSGYFMLSYSGEIRQSGGRQAYLENRIALLRDAVEKAQ